MNVVIGTEAAQFPEKEYINGIFLAVWGHAEGRNNVDTLICCVQVFFGFR